VRLKALFEGFRIVNVSSESVKYWVRNRTANVDIETIVQPLSDNNYLRRVEMIRRLQATELRSNVFWYLYRA
jgi:hypothetical protein